MKIRVFLSAFFGLYTSILNLPDCQAGRNRALGFIKESLFTFFPAPRPSIKLDRRMYSSSSFSPEKFKVPSKAKIRIEGLNYSIHTKQLFDGLDFLVTSGDKVTIVGENGVGKSTLLKIMAAENIDYDGKVEIQGNVGYLPQSLEYLENRPAIEHIIYHSQRDDWKNLAYEINSLPFNTWFQEFKRQGGYSVFKTLSQMKLPHEILKRNLFSLSGGEKIKVHLCSLHPVAYSHLIF